MNLKQKVGAISALLIAVVAVTSAVILNSAGKAADDADIMNALGRQRMLTQTMAKAALVYSQKGEFTSIKTSVRLLDEYITHMRAVYTKTVAARAQRAGIQLSMDMTDDEKRAAFPFPATLTRMVNESFVKGNALEGKRMTLDVISENPVNSEKGLKTAMDKEASEYLKKNPDKMFTATEERDGLYLIFYTPDKASVEACATCHMGLKGGSLKVGDVLGARKFEILFSQDAAVGKAQLNPTMTEYENAVKVFAETLAAMKNGGSYPADLAMTASLKTGGIEGKEAQAKMERIEAQLAKLKDVARTLTASENDKEIQAAQVSIGDEANRLRQLSDELVGIYAGISARNQRAIINSAWISALLITATSLALSAFVWFRILKPMEAVTLALRDIAEGEGDMTRRLPEATRDEIGALAHWFNMFVGNLTGIIGQISGNSTSLARASGEMNDVSSALATASEQMNAQANNVAGSTEQMSVNITTVAAAVEQMSMNVSSVSTGAEEMSASMKGVAGSVEALTVSINKINIHAREASGVAKQVMDRSRMAESAMKNLGEAATAIGKVTDVIKRIAEQTNLLALNATIEAASAGAAGKGFAVVANEIKQLASQSASAAEDIYRRIEGVQNNTEKAVGVIGEALSTIGLINEAVDLITNLVEAQSKAAMEISGSVAQASTGADNIAASIAEVAKGANEVSRNTGEAAQGASDVSSNIHGVSTAAREASASARKVSASSGDIARIASELESLVGRFKVA
jgi:methyl-accepting chemotaxis protein